MLVTSEADTMFQHALEEAGAPLWTDRARFGEALDAELRRALRIDDEANLDALWSLVRHRVLELATRPGKRIRPWLVFAGWSLAGGPPAAPRGLWRFAAAVELLHAFVLVHDDVADRADQRRGGPALHRALEPLGPGGDLAVVAGDHLFARAVELMLESELPGAARATSRYLRTCRHTAIGQLLDLSLPHRPLHQLDPTDALHVAHLKTARYSFAAPLVAGGLLAGAPDAQLQALERCGELAGLAFQLQDDLLSIEADTREAGKPVDGDLLQAKRTFPLLVAYRRGGPEDRAALEALHPGASSGVVAHAREVIRRHGVPLTERVLSRAVRGAHAALAELAAPPEAVAAVASALQGLARPG